MPREGFGGMTMQRMMLSVVLAFLVGALLGKLLLPVLHKLKFGQNI